jgi:hypothetical protein
MQSMSTDPKSSVAINLLSQQAMTVITATVSACMHMHGRVGGDGDNRRGFKN